MQRKNQLQSLLDSHVDKDSKNIDNKTKIFIINNTTIIPLSP